MKFYQHSLLLILLSLGSFQSVLAQKVEISQAVIDGNNVTTYLKFLPDRSFNANKVVKKEDLDMFLQSSDGKQSRLTIATDPTAFTPMKVSEREGFSCLFLIDMSRSITDDQFTALKQALLESVSNVVDEDQVAIATFGNNYQEVSDYTGDIATLSKALQGLQPYDQKTSLYDAIWQAYQKVKKHNGNKRSVVILVTDGKNDSTNGIKDFQELIRGKRDEITNQTIENAPYPFYVVALADNANMKELAKVTGGEYKVANVNNFHDTFNFVGESIRNVNVLEATCAGILGSCPSASPLKVMIKSGTNNEGIIQASLFPSNFFSRWLWWLLGGASIIAIGAGIYTGMRLKKRWTSEIEDDPDILSVVQPNPIPVSPPDNFPDIRSNQDIKIQSIISDLPIKIPQDVKPPAVPVNMQNSSLGVSIRLTVIKGVRPGKDYSYKFVDTCVIGHNRNKCDIVLGRADDDADNSISGVHCIIKYRNKMFYIQDENSTNGTTLNGVVLPAKKPERLYPGESIIGIGNATLRFNVVEKRK